MTTLPTVAPRDWIQIGRTPAVVTEIYEESPNAIEVVYMDRGRAMREYAVWEGGLWQFFGPGGGCADGCVRLREFVAILTAGWGRSPLAAAQIDSS